MEACIYFNVIVPYMMAHSSEVILQEELRTMHNCCSAEIWTNIEKADPPRKIRQGDTSQKISTRGCVYKIIQYIIDFNADLINCDENCPLSNYLTVNRF